MSKYTVNSEVELTQKQMEVMSWMALGYKARVIADKMFVSRRTVEFHVASVYSLLNTNNRTSALRILGKAGILIEDEKELERLVSL